MKIYSNLNSFQDRHIPAHSRNGAPVLDNSQDYAPLSGHRNSSHTTLRFKRKLSTCDEKYDIAITVRIMVPCRVHRV